MGLANGQKLAPTGRSRFLDFAVFTAAVLFCAFSWKNLGVTAHTRATNPAPVVSRAPSAVLPARNVPERSTQTISLGCLSPGKKNFHTEASLLQLNAGLCLGASATAGRNETTGENLLLFAREGVVSTHYFPVKAGANRIRIEWIDAKHRQSSQEIEVERSL